MCLRPAATGVSDRGLVCLRPGVTGVAEAWCDWRV